jgi:hypothetical protein
VALKGGTARGEQGVWGKLGGWGSLTVAAHPPGGCGSMHPTGGEYTRRAAVGRVCLFFLDPGMVSICVYLQTIQSSAL